MFSILFRRIRRTPLRRILLFLLALFMTIFVFISFTYSWLPSPIPSSANSSGSHLKGLKNVLSGRSFSGSGSNVKNDSRKLVLVGSSTDETGKLLKEPFVVDPSTIGVSSDGPSLLERFRQKLYNYDAKIAHEINPTRDNTTLSKKTEDNVTLPGQIWSSDESKLEIPPPPSSYSTSSMKGQSSRKLIFSGPGNMRQEAVVHAFQHAWDGYRTYAWGMDILHPISKRGSNSYGFGLTILDSIDTMWIMGLKKEYSEARNWISSLDFNVIDSDVNLFETTIRALGGLLSIYHLTGDPLFKTKAEDLGSILLHAFNSDSGIPRSDVNLKTKLAHDPAWAPYSSTSEIATLQLEFRDLSRITQNPIFEEKTMNVSKILSLMRKWNGLLPLLISPKSGEFTSSSVLTLGARGDSYYEYLLKQWIQTGRTIDFLLKDYLEAMNGVKEYLVKTTEESNLTFVGELTALKAFYPKMDHLVCFLPGTLALGHSFGLPDWHLDLAKSLLETCHETYRRQPTGLAPEITHFLTNRNAESTQEDLYVKSNDAHNLLRPETVESLWYLYEYTRNKTYQDWGWEIFQSFLKYTKVEHGFTSINSVLKPLDPGPRDIMESFFLAETLKYFYLLFSDTSTFSLKEWVFNTEAHPLPILDH